MPEQTLSERVEILERKEEALKSLPERVAVVESQILQLRGEMHAGFSAIDQRFEAVDRRFDAVDARFDRLERQIREGDEETRRYMRVLYEDLVARLAVSREGGRARRKKDRK